MDLALRTTDVIVLIYCDQQGWSVTEDLHAFSERLIIVLTLMKELIRLPLLWCLTLLTTQFCYFRRRTFELQEVNYMFCSNNSVQYRNYSL